MSCLVNPKDIDAVSEFNGGKICVIYHGRSVSLSLVARPLKKNHQEKVSTAKDFERKFLLPTSNIIERLFSNLVFALNNPLKGFVPTNLEIQTFLLKIKEYLNFKIERLSAVNIIVRMRSLA